MVSFNFNLVKEPVHILKEYLYMYYYGILESCVKKKINKERKNIYIQKMPVNDLFLTMYSE